MSAVTEKSTKTSFQGGGKFAADVKSEVKAYLAQPGVKARAYLKLWLKAAIIIVWAAYSYKALVFAPHSWEQILLWGTSLAAAATALQFCVMHDANHDAFSTSKRVNFFAGLALDLVGGKREHWRKKHNDSHHGLTNLVRDPAVRDPVVTDDDEENDDKKEADEKWDDDLDQPPFARFSLSQIWRRWHPYQQYYLWFMYGAVLFRWLTVGDFVALRRGKIAGFKLNPLPWRERLRFYATKLAAVGWMIVIPMAYNWSWLGALVVLATYVVLMWTASTLIIITFQLAHCVEGTETFSPQDADENGKLPEWMRAQVMATQDFCHGRLWRPLTWYLGGLNYQIEHHLFPHVPHTAYPGIAPIVQKACERHGLTYVCKRTPWDALVSHFLHLREMGRKPVTEPATS